MIQRQPRISDKKRLLLIKYFGMDLNASESAKLCKVHRNTANFWYRHFREVIYHHTRLAPRFFGEVEMDQSEFGGRGRKRMQAYLKRLAKSLNHADYLAKARDIRKEHKVLVFGLLQRGGGVYVHIIKRADRRTLAPIIRLVVEANSTLYSDKWRAFEDIPGYTHLDINHSLTYSDKKGVHINGIESFWSYAKRRTAQFNGIARTTLPLHIKECEFRYNHKDVAKALKKLFTK